MGLDSPVWSYFLSTDWATGQPAIPINWQCSNVTGMWNLSGSLCFQKTSTLSLLNSPCAISKASIADLALNSTNASTSGLRNVWMPL